MEASIVREKLVASYWALLSHLDADIRVELIHKLADSLKNEATPTEEEPSWKKLYGAWESEQEPEEIIAEIRDSRLFNHERAAF